MMKNTVRVDNQLLHRPIRSYVRREGRLTTAQQTALETLWPVYGCEINQIPELFSSHLPIVLEIGYGTGESLLLQAKHHPDTYFLGIEVYTPGIGSLLLKIQKENILNLRIINYDAAEILNAFVPDNAISKIQIFFPDPWQKKRHHKRRLIQDHFLSLCAQKLKHSGILHIATDWENYAADIAQQFLSADLYVKYNSCLIPYERPETKFERRGKKLGHQVWDFIYQKN